MPAHTENLKSCAAGPIVKEGMITDHPYSE